MRLLAFAACFYCLHGRAQVPIITAAEAGQHLYTFATVCDTVVQTVFDEDSRQRPTYINLGGAYPNQSFTAIIWGIDLYRFAPQPHQWLQGKYVCVTGMVLPHKGKPQIVLRWAEQLEING